MGRIRVGLSSWTDKSLIECGRFYPAGVDSAEERLRFYAGEFPDLVEVNSTYYGLPSERNATYWVQRTPAGFLFDVKLFSLLTHHPTQPASLPKDLWSALPADIRQKPQIYFHHLPQELSMEAMRRFVTGLLPLQRAGKLGTILCQFPRWFAPGPASLSHIAWCQEQLHAYPMAVEFRQAGWLSETQREQTLGFLKERGLSYVAVDEPQGTPSSVPPLADVTQPTLAYLRFHGRQSDAWEKTSASVQERTRYLYSEQELMEWVPRIHSMAEHAQEVHVLLNTNFEDHAVRNARALRRLLGLPDSPQLRLI